MNYEKTVTWMFQQLPMYQTQGAIAYKANLDNIHLLDKHLGHPHLAYKTIHVAGTNGKGSTSAMLASILKTAGYKVGLYTSPHLKDYRERITINGTKISKAYVTKFINNNKTFFEGQALSFFEMSVGLALSYFKDKKVDIAVIEVGMGGRLDATNIITPIVSIITSIGMDHTQFLGNTLEAIAIEKAGIIKNNIPVAIGDYHDSLKSIFNNIARKKNTICYFTHQNEYEEYASDLKGLYQNQNKKTVLEAIKIIKNNGLEITKKHIKNGLLNVVKNTGLQGRWHVLGEKPMIVCDTAHNKDGLAIVSQQISTYDFKQLHIIIGLTNDKNVDEILPLLPKSAKYYFVAAKNLRAMDAYVLKEKATDLGYFGDTYDSVSNAYRNAIKSAAPDDFIFIGGSNFIVAEIL